MQLLKYIVSKTLTVKISRWIKSARSQTLAEVLLPKGKFLSLSVTSLVLLVSPLAISTAQAQNTVEFEIPLMVNDALSGNIAATITETIGTDKNTTIVTVDKERLTQLLENFANDEQLQQWLGDEPISNIASGAASSVSIGSQVTIPVSATKSNEAITAIGNSIDTAKSADSAAADSVKGENKPSTATDSVTSGEETTVEQLEENQVEESQAEESLVEENVAANVNTEDPLTENATANDIPENLVDDYIISQSIAFGSSSISLYELRQRGLEISFDPAFLSINSTVPLLGIRPLSLGSNRGPLARLDDTSSASGFSSGLNYNITNVFNHRSRAAVEQGLGDTLVTFDGFTNIGGFGGWSLFYEGDYLENDEREFARGDVALIHDSFKNGVRYTFGDVLPSVSNLQNSPNLLGFSIERNYEEINPNRNLRPSGRSRFELDRSARVSFEINGVIVETRQLEPGNYSVQDFPFTAGANNVRVIVDDGFSNVEVANFSAFSDIELLARGLSNFGISAGVQQSNTIGRTRRYDDEIALLAFYERGISDKFTAGVQGEASENHILLGSTLAYGSRFGLIGLEVAASKREGFETAFSSTVIYENTFDLKHDWSIRTNLQFDYQTADFGGLTAEGPVDERRGFLSSFSVSKAGYNLFLNTSTFTAGDIRTDAYSLGMSKTFGRYTLTMDYRNSQVEGAEAIDSFSLALSGRFGKSLLRGQYQTLDDRSELTWNGPAPRDAGRGFINRIAAINDQDTTSAELNAGYIGSNFLFGVDHIETQEETPTGEDNSASATNLRLGGSIGFAGGQLAFGRPFNDGFIIANTHKNLRGKKVSVTRGSRNGDLVTTKKRLSSTLIPINGSYTRQRYIIEIDDLPIGYDIGAGQIEVVPGFLAGYNYKIGSDAANTLIGNVLWPDNTPPSLIVGKLIPQSSDEAITVFTNKTGRFVAEKLLPGKYTMIFNNGEDDFSVELEIEPRDEPGLIKLGTVTLKKHDDEQEGAQEEE